MEQAMEQASENQEELPMEGQESAEVSEQAVVDALAANPELRLGECSEYNQWMDQEQAKVSSEQEGLYLALRDAELRQKAGRSESAKNALLDARDQAYQMYDDTLVADIDRRLHELGGGQD